MTNKDEFEKYLKMSADKEDDVSILYYISLLKNNNTNENKRKIEKFLNKSAHKGNEVSMLLYGLMLYNNNKFDFKNT